MISPELTSIEPLFPSSLIVYLPMHVPFVRDDIP